MGCTESPWSAESARDDLIGQVQQNNICFYIHTLDGATKFYVVKLGQQLLSKPPQFQFIAS